MSELLFHTMKVGGDGGC